MKAILGILGATGVGKSAVAVEVAKILDSSVISCDSMQVYKGLDVSTAKIRQDEMQGVRHFMLDVVSPQQSFSAFDFQQTVCKQVLPIFEQQDIVPIVAGGTGLYFESLIYGLDFVGSSCQNSRQQLMSIYENEGVAPLLEMLKQQDFSAFQKVDKDNVRRVVRAIEISQAGQSISQSQIERQERFENIPFILCCDRQLMYRNIEKRVEEMVENGLFEEVESVLNECDGNSKLQCFQAIGCKEVVGFLKGDFSKQQAIDAIKINTRHYAKRQVTFFKRIKGQYIDVQEYENSAKIAENIVEVYRRMTKN